MPDSYNTIRQRLAERPQQWLVTGVAGFIGSNLLEALLKLDQTVVGLDNFSTGHQHNLDEVRSLVTPEQWSRFVAVNATGPLMMARAVVPHMLRAKRGRIVTVTTSLGTMLREGYILYGASKAAAEAATAIMSADLAGTGVTANVLVPGGMTDTRIIADGAVADRSRLLRPEIMAPPLLWLVSDAAAEVTGRRFLAVHWDASLPPAEAAEKCGAPIAWKSIATMPIEPD